MVNDRIEESTEVVSYHRLEERILQSPSVHRNRAMDKETLTAITGRFMYSLVVLVILFRFVSHKYGIRYHSSFFGNEGKDLLSLSFMTSHQDLHTFLILL